MVKIKAAEAKIFWLLVPSTAPKTLHLPECNSFAPFSRLTITKTRQGGVTSTYSNASYAVLRIYWAWWTPGGRAYQCLYDGVVGGVHVGIKGEGALSITVVGCVAFRSNDPVLRETRQ